MGDPPSPFNLHHTAGGVPGIWGCTSFSKRPSLAQGHMLGADLDTPPASPETSSLTKHLPRTD